MRRSILVPGLASIAALGLMLSGCTSGGDGGGDAGGDTSGVPFGASIEEYQAAFADVDPVSLRIQVGSAEGAAGDIPLQAWADSVEEWSDGKVTFEWGYSNAFVPNAAEVYQALGDGRLDVVNSVPYTAPSLFPALTQVYNAGITDPNTPTGQLVGPAWLTEQLFTNPEIVAEADAAGVHFVALRPLFAPSVLQCPEDWGSLSELAGKTSFAAGPANVAQLTALGIAPATIPYTELYESVERGIVDCINLTLHTGLLFGVAERLPNAVFDSENSFGSHFGFWTIGKEKWDSLPVVAQQLLYDRAELIYKGDDTFNGDLGIQSLRNLEWFDTVGSLGGGLRELDSDASRALADANASLLDQLAAEGLDLGAIEDLQAKWTGIIEELYPGLETDFEEFIRAGGFNEVDLTGFNDAIYREVYLQVRP